MSGNSSFHPLKGLTVILLAAALLGIIHFLGSPPSDADGQKISEPVQTESVATRVEPLPQDLFPSVWSNPSSEERWSSVELPVDIPAIEPLPEPAVQETTFSISVRITGGPGQVTPAHQVVMSQGRAEISIQPSPGYRLGSLLDNGSPKVAGKSYIMDKVSENHDLTVTFINDSPLVTLLEPVEGMPVLGRVTVQALIVDDGELAGAELLVNGRVVQRLREPLPTMMEEPRIPGFIQTEDFSFAASPGGVQLSDEGALRQILDDGRAVPLLCPDFELRELQVLPERGWLLLSFGRDRSDSYGQRSPVLLLDPARSRANGLVASGFEILPASEPGREPFELNQDGSLSFSVRDTLTGDLSRARWSSVEGWRFRPLALNELPSPLPRSQIAWLEFGPVEDGDPGPPRDRTWTFSFDSQQENPGPLDLSVRAWDQAEAIGEARVSVRLTPIELLLSGQRNTVSAGSLSRQYGWLHLVASAPEGTFARLRLMRRTGNGLFVPQVTFSPDQFSEGSQDYADRYLHADQVYRYRLEALDQTGRVLGRSEELEL